MSKRLAVCSYTSFLSSNHSLGRLGLQLFSLYHSATSATRSRHRETTSRLPFFVLLHFQTPDTLSWPVKMDMLLLLWLIILGVMALLTFAGVFVLLVPVIDSESSGGN